MRIRTSDDQHLHGLLFRDNEYLQQYHMPVMIFHGNQDEVIYYGSSLKLQQAFKPEDKFITLMGQRHNGITENHDYQRIIAQILTD